MKTKTPLRTALILALACSSMGCGESEQDPDAEGCEHLEEGPAVPVTAGTMAAAAPAIDADHKRYDVTLVDAGGAKGGIVRFAASEAADHVFFLNASVPVRFLDPAGAEVIPERSATASPSCPAIKAKHVVPLTVGTFTISIGPTSQTSVGIVVEEAHAH